MDRYAPLIASVVACLMLALSSEARGQSALVFHVREGATGSATGLDWSNAYPALPDTLVRGATYFIADGSYPQYKFDDAADGTKYITVKKATGTAHGSDAGWQPAYGDGTALWAPTLKFASSYYVFDGIVGGNSGAAEPRHGFHMSSTSDIIFLMLSDKWAGPSGRVNVSNVRISHVSVSGRVPVTPGIGTAVDATAFGAEFDSITLSHCRFTDIGGPVFYFLNTSNLLIEQVYVARNASSPEHHGVMIQLGGSSRSVTIRRSHFRDIVGTGWIGSYTNVSDVAVYRNVFAYSDGYVGSYGNGVVFTLGSTTATRWSVNNNTFVNLPGGRLIYFFGGGSNTAYNNLFHRIHEPPAFLNVVHDYSWFSEPTGSFGEANSIAGSTDPFIDWRNGDYRLKQDHAEGLPLSLYEATDAAGLAATLRWSRGAYQWTKPPTPPLNLRIVQ